MWSIMWLLLTSLVLYLLVKFLTHFWPPRNIPKASSAMHAIFQSPTIASVDTHTMGASLTEYLQMKVHPLIQNHSWAKILVIGDHQRDSSKVIIASNEKRDKPFNWMRPTASVIDSNTLCLHVFPGRDYVEHYAAIVATYLSLKGEKEASLVRFKYPSQEDCLKVFAASNLADLGTVDIVILGYVEGLYRSDKGAASWEEEEEVDASSDDENNNNLFSWKTTHTAHGHRVAFLGCRICFWGDIGGHLVRTLRKLNHAKCVLYVGKLGSLRPEHIPNRTLASGNRSFVNGGGELVVWQNPLEPYLFLQQKQDAGAGAAVVLGVHTCIASVLYETHDWLLHHQKQHHQDNRIDFVDPEIGQMAKASLEEQEQGACQFGYLHIVSDNLARKYGRDLSNERLEDVRRDRDGLLEVIRTVLGRFLDGWTTTTSTSTSTAPPRTSFG